MLGPVVDARPALLVAEAGLSRVKELPGNGRVVRLGCSEVPDRSGQLLVAEDVLAHDRSVDPCVAADAPGEPQVEFRRHHERRWVEKER